MSNIIDNRPAGKVAKDPIKGKMQNAPYQRDKADAARIKAETAAIRASTARTRSETANIRKCTKNGTDTSGRKRSYVAPAEAPAEASVDDSCCGPLRTSTGQRIRIPVRDTLANLILSIAATPAKDGLGMLADLEKCEQCTETATALSHNIIMLFGGYEYAGAAICYGTHLMKHV